MKVKREIINLPEIAKNQENRSSTRLSSKKSPSSPILILPPQKDTAMARHRPHERKYHEDENENNASDESTTPPLLNSLITSRMNNMLPLLPPDGPPRGDDEAKREFYRDLVRLKEQRYSHKQCAQALNVSERSIVNYVADPLYKEIQQEMIADSKQRGHLLIAETIDEALTTLYQLMKPDPKVSPFVRFKAAEALLNYAGYNMPREEAHSDAREGLSKFLAEVEARKHQTIVQVNVSTEKGREESTMVVDGTTQREEMNHTEMYQQMVLPGGKLPPLPFSTASTLPVPDDPE